VLVRDDEAQFAAAQRLVEQAGAVTAMLEYGEVEFGHLATVEEALCASVQNPAADFADCLLTPQGRRTLATSATSPPLPVPRWCPAGAPLVPEVELPA
jgi:hypothetical protein